MRDKIFRSKSEGLLPAQNKKDIQKKKSDIDLNKDHTLEFKKMRLRDIKQQKESLLDFKYTYDKSNVIKHYLEDLESLNNEYLEHRAQADLKHHIVDSWYGNEVQTLNEDREKQLNNLEERNNQIKTLLDKEYKHKLDAINKLEEKGQLNNENSKTPNHVSSFLKYMTTTKRSTIPENIVLTEEEKGRIKQEWNALGRKETLSEEDNKKVIMLYYREIAKSCSKYMDKDKWEDFVNYEGLEKHEKS